jgi:hypothetical protein
MIAYVRFWSFLVSFVKFILAPSTCVTCNFSEVLQNISVLCLNVEESWFYIAKYFAILVLCLSFSGCFCIRLENISPSDAERLVTWHKESAITYTLQICLVTYSIKCMCTWASQVTTKQLDFLCFRATVTVPILLRLTSSSDNNNETWTSPTVISHVTSPCAFDTSAVCFMCNVERRTALGSRDQQLAVVKTATPSLSSEEAKLNSIFISQAEVSEVLRYETRIVLNVGELWQLEG